MGRSPLAGLVRIAIMIPDAIRNGFKNPAREGFTDDMLNIPCCWKNVRVEED